VAIEPVISIRNQLLLWSLGYSAFCILAAICAWQAGAKVLPGALVPIPQRLLWVALAACPAVLWLGIANELSQNVAPIPLLWILPMSIYLLTFILSFDRDGFYQPALFRIVLPVAWITVGYCLARHGALVLPVTILLFSAALFACCMFCHGELARRKPHP